MVYTKAKRKVTKSRNVLMSDEEWLLMICKRVGDSIRMKIVSTRAKAVSRSTIVSLSSLENELLIS